MDTQIVNLISGFVLSGAMKGAKKVQAIPIGEGQKGRIRIVLLVLSALVSFGNAYLSGELASETLLKPFVDSLVTFAYTQASHNLFFKGKVPEVA